MPQPPRFFATAQAFRGWLEKLVDACSGGVRLR
jgi:hypothetical protein